MADDTTTNRPSLTNVAHDQSDELSTVGALLAGAAAMLIGDGATQPFDPDSVFRLVSCANERIKAVQGALDPYI